MSLRPYLVCRLKTFEPPEKNEENKVQIKLFLDDEIRFLETEHDVSYEELIIAVGKVFIEQYSIKFEDAEKHHITLKSSDDLKLAIRSYETVRVVCGIISHAYVHTNAK